jgi:hypothetical protein
MGRDSLSWTLYYPHSVLNNNYSNWIPHMRMVTLIFRLSPSTLEIALILKLVHFPSSSLFLQSVLHWASTLDLMRLTTSPMCIMLIKKLHSAELPLQLSVGMYTSLRLQNMIPSQYKRSSLRLNQNRFPIPWLKLKFGLSREIATLTWPLKNSELCLIKSALFLSHCLHLLMLLFAMP